jgi:hypothetical protein
MFASPDTIPDPLSQTLRGEKSLGGAPGWLGSVLLHLLLLLAIFALIRNTPQAPQNPIRLVPINIIRLGENTTSPPQQLKASVPQQSRPEKIVRHSIPAATAPARKPSPQDALDAQLRSLSKLREPETNLPVLDNAGSSNVDATSDDALPGSQAAYSIRDYIRNQVERRWSLNFGRIGHRTYTVLIHIALKRNGEITKAEVVDRARFATDAAYRDVALSARNAVLLSSPIALPAGQRSMPMEITLNLNPKDTLR